MTKVTTLPFDPAEYLDTEEAQLAYLDEAFGTGDAAFIARSIGVVARARGMTMVARQAGLARESLYKALGEDGNPEFGTILKVLGALGMGLSVRAGITRTDEATPLPR